MNGSWPVPARRRFKDSYGVPETPAQRQEHHQQQWMPVINCDFGGVLSMRPEADVPNPIPAATALESFSSRAAERRTPCITPKTGNREPSPRATNNHLGCGNSSRRVQNRIAARVEVIQRHPSRIPRSQEREQVTSDAVAAGAQLSLQKSGEPSGYL